MSVLKSRVGMSNLTTRMTANYPNMAPSINYGTICGGNESGTATGATRPTSSLQGAYIDVAYTGFPVVIPNTSGLAIFGTVRTNSGDFDITAAGEGHYITYIGSPSIKVLAIYSGNILFGFGNTFTHSFVQSSGGTNPTGSTIVSTTETITAGTEEKTIHNQTILTLNTGDTIGIDYDDGGGSSSTNGIQVLTITEIGSAGATGAQGQPRGNIAYAELYMQGPTSFGGVSTPGNVISGNWYAITGTTVGDFDPQAIDTTTSSDAFIINPGYSGRYLVTITASIRSSFGGADPRINLGVSIDGNAPTTSTDIELTLGTYRNVTSTSIISLNPLQVLIFAVETLGNIITDEVSIRDFSATIAMVGGSAFLTIPNSTQVNPGDTISPVTDGTTTYYINCTGPPPANPQITLIEQGIDGMILFLIANNPFPGPGITTTIGPGGTAVANNWSLLNFTNPGHVITLYYDGSGLATDGWYILASFGGAAITP